MTTAETTTTAPHDKPKPPPEAHARKHKKCRTLADLQNDPRVEWISIEETGYWISLASGGDCVVHKGETGEGTSGWGWWWDECLTCIHEPTIKEACEMMNQIWLMYIVDGELYEW